jgi:hypothetical protein
MPRYDYYFRSIKDNLYKVFGTYSLFSVLSPSLRNVPFTGIEWSYQLKDQGYGDNHDVEGKLVLDAQEELEMSQISSRKVGDSSQTDNTLDSIDSQIEL